MGAMAVYMYSLNSRLYTVRIIMKASTVMNSPPSRVTTHKGMDSRNPTSLIMSTISWGKVVLPPVVTPASAMMEDTMP